MIGDDLGKNSLPKTSAAIVPYSRKSYHSIVVPTVLAMTARRSWARCSSADKDVRRLLSIVIASLRLWFWLTAGRPAAGLDRVTKL